MIMRRGLLFLACLLTAACAQDTPNVGFRAEEEALLAQSQEKFEFQSDIARLMRVVVSHLYHDRDVFLRELISNSGDALEKLRFASLTDSSVLDSAPALNISIIADKPQKRLIIRDSGVGMTREDLQKNLGTIARSGTADFLAKLESSGEGSNLIGQFGLGFYSSFLVADRVTVASKNNDDPKQWVFESEADKGEFKIAEDPRGSVLGRGTEITLHLKDDALEFLEVEKLRSLISTHSEFSTQAPIYIWTEKDTEVPVEEDTVAEPAVDEEKQEIKDQVEEEENQEKETELDEEAQAKDDEKSEDAKPKTKTVKTSIWDQVNTKGPIWTRDPKDVPDEDYIAFYKASQSTTLEPKSWTHFKGDAGRTSFSALVYIPPEMPSDTYSKTYAQFDAVRLYVRRVLITKEPSPDFLPKWLNWIKVIVDADDLPLNVGRDSLQATKSLRQIKNTIIRKFLDHLNNVATNDLEKFSTISKMIGTTLKIGAVEDAKHRDRITKILRFTSSVDEATSLSDYVVRRKKGQKQIFYIAGAGQDAKSLAQSPFVEKLVARGYEVLYFVEPMDEMISSTLSTYEGMRFQDAAKKGLLMGDEEEDAIEKQEVADANKEFSPLIQWIKKELDAHVSEVVISTRLTMSPCAIIADSFGWTGNMERLMTAQYSRAENPNALVDFMKNAKRTFEINPKHPLIKGLLQKVEDAEGDAEATEELKESVNVLWDTALLRSGFTIKDANTYFVRVEQLLRRSLGVSESAKAEKAHIRPAPPVEEGPFVPAADDGPTSGGQPGDWADWSDLKGKLKQKEDIGKVTEPEEVSHDEL